MTGIIRCPSSKEVGVYNCGALMSYPTSMANISNYTHFTTVAASFDRSRAKQRSEVGQQSRGKEPEKSSEGEAGEARDDSDGEDGDEHSDDWYSDDD